MFWFRANIYDVGPTLKQQCVNVSCLARQWMGGGWSSQEVFSSTTSRLPSKRWGTLHKRVVYLKEKESYVAASRVSQRWATDTVSNPTLAWCWANISLKFWRGWSPHLSTDAQMSKSNELPLMHDQRRSILLASAIINCVWGSDPLVTMTTCYYNMSTRPEQKYKQSRFWVKQL